MFYEIHSLGEIGYKKLTLAELGLGMSSHQTHIGLHESSVDYLRSFDRRYLSSLMYEDSYEDMLFLLEVIERKDGTMEAPYIRSGNVRELSCEGETYQSVVKGTRSIVKKEVSRNWFLLWLSLANDELFFFLVNDTSIDFKNITSILGSLKAHGVIDHHHPSYNQIISFQIEKVYSVKKPYLEKLELNAQTGGLLDNIPLPHSFDLERAKNIIKAFGIKGKELFSDYLNKLLVDNKIRSFDWKNKSRESGFPFDFEIMAASRELLYADVKSTSYSFKQGMIFSHQEVKFMSQHPNYRIFRVSNINENNPLFRICNDYTSFANALVITIDNTLQSFLKNHSKVRSINIGATPLHKGFVFDKRIIRLNYN